LLLQLTLDEKEKRLAAVVLKLRDADEKIAQLQAELNGVEQEAGALRADYTVSWPPRSSQGLVQDRQEEALLFPYPAPPFSRPPLLEGLTRQALVRF
jgi:hypothetical protein